MSTTNEKKVAVQATRLNAFSIEPERLTLIDDPKHHLYDERIKLPIDEHLVLNIMVHGVKIPVLATKEGELLIVVDGRQRVKAAIEANKRLKKDGSEPIKVKMILERGDEADLFGICILANEMRQEDDVVLKARKAKRLLDMNSDKKRCANIFGVSVLQIERWLKVLDLAAPVIRAIEAGEITATAASELSNLTREAQIEALAELKQNAPKDKKGATKKVSTKAAKKAAGKPVPAKEGAETSLATPHERPSLRDLKRVYGDQRLPDEDKNLLGWVLGELSAKDSGMDEYLTEEPEAAAAEG